MCCGSPANSGSRTTRPPVGKTLEEKRESYYAQRNIPNPHTTPQIKKSKPQNIKIVKAKKPQNYNAYKKQQKNKEVDNQSITA